jgi:murein DD-endopeptidase MepM/ murein hydrolase activator NlpD
VRQLAPGVWEIPIMIDGADSVEGATLTEATRNVREEASAALDKAKADQVALNARLPQAVAAYESAVKARETAESDLKELRALFEGSRGLVARIGVVSYVNHMSATDPEVLLLEGQTEQSMVRKAFSSSAAQAALDGHAENIEALDKATEASKKARSKVTEAKSEVDEIKSEIEKAKGIQAQAEQMLLAMFFESQAQATQTPVASPVNPGVALTGGPDLAVSNLLRMAGPTTFPIAGDWDFIDSWGFPRSGGRTHKGADIFSDKGTPVVALEDGVVKTGSNSLGGEVIYLFGRSGNRYYYAHLSGFVPNIEGAQVVAGQVIGFVGNSGNAISTPPHLHFEVRVPQLMADINPYPMLQTLSTAVDTARVKGATSLVPGAALPLMTVEAARAEWNAGKVSHSTMSYLDADTMAGLINSGRVTVSALSLSPPAVYNAAKAKINAAYASMIPPTPGPELPFPKPPVVMPTSMRPGTKSASTSAAAVAAAAVAATTTTAAGPSGASG